MKPLVFALQLILFWAVTSARADESIEFDIFGLKLGMTAEEASLNANRLGLTEVHRTHAPSDDQAAALKRGEVVQPEAYAKLRKLQFEGKDVEVEVDFDIKGKVPQVRLIQWTETADKGPHPDLQKQLVEKYGAPNAKRYKSLIWGDTQPLPLRTKPSLEYRFKTVTTMVGKNDVNVLTLRETKIH